MSERKTIRVGSVLTRDNIHLSRPKNVGILRDETVAIDCKPSISDYVRASVSENTQRAYRSDLAHFEGWGGVIPCSPETVSAYLADHAESLSIATLKRRLASIAVVHTAQGLPSPTTSKLVRATLRGIQRTHSKPQQQAKPLLIEHLLQIMASLEGSPKDLRDRALLMIGFAGGFRRSELVAIDCNDIEMVRQGAVVTIRRSKSDQEGAGRKIGIPLARGVHCPVLSLEVWIQHAEITTGPVFRPVSRHGNVADRRLSAEAVSLIVRQRMETIGYHPDNYSGHSLRSGLATSAAAAGVPSWKIRAQTGHASDAMLNRYIRTGELFAGNAAAALF